MPTVLRVGTLAYPVGRRQYLGVAVKIKFGSVDRDPHTGREQKLCMFARSHYASQLSHREMIVEDVYIQKRTCIKGRQLIERESPGAIPRLSKTKPAAHWGMGRLGYCLFRLVAVVGSAATSVIPGLPVQ